ncbi:hypothetical protein IV203_035219 [Nitzschia inconspicua]|uniref:START domain-containing protein n=1 Tax=Nitzschia inconspicua TaxID=303405 RepID=A0A9K3LE05_9STRA|nr:hypothetical protein IV203_035219 [Nitzschia inconspicua]
MGTTTEVNTTQPLSTDKDDATIVQEADELFAVERLLNAADLLEQVQDKALLQDRHHMMLRWAVAVRKGINDLLQDPEEKTNAEENPWKKQSETHGHRDFFVYYQITDQNQLISRIDCAIESSLLIPILAVFNESDLYATWMPSWNKPIKLGISQTRKLKESGRGNQIIQVTTSLAWPFYDRDLIMHVVAVDVIDEQQCIAIHAMSESHQDDPVIPEPSPKQVRIDYDCSILIRACPPDHPCLAKSKHEYPEGEELLLFSLEMNADPHVNAIPQSLQNFVTRTVIGRFWSSLMHVAEDIREGKRPQHKEAIDQKREMYDWIDQRISVMIQRLKEQNGSDHGGGGSVPAEYN